MVWTLSFRLSSSPWNLEPLFGCVAVGVAIGCVFQCCCDIVPYSRRATAEAFEIRLKCVSLKNPRLQLERVSGVAEVRS